MSLIVLLGLIIVGVLAWQLRLHLQKVRRNRLFHEPLPPSWIQILSDNVSLYSRLPNNLKNELHGRINIFLNEKKFFGCDGIEITDEIRITIAGNACMLLLKRDKHCFPWFSTIFVYPTTFVSQVVENIGGLHTHKDSIRSGESWHRGPIVLSWENTIHDSRNDKDGHNVVLHEFAHKLDEENNIMDGLPVLRESSHYSEWAQVLTIEYASFLKRVDKRNNSVIDSYGAVSAVEFFAVVTESFFEKPVQMKIKLPELYEQFKKFYHLDPASWHR